MHEVRIHGRGGQGVVLASKILAKALVEEGQFVSAVPQFGFERRGAPVVAYLRYDEAELKQPVTQYIIMLVGKWSIVNGGSSAPSSLQT